MSKFAKFWYQLQNWSNETFGPVEERGPIPPLNHLKREVNETIKSPQDLIEYADLIHLVFDACRRAGYELRDLQHACFAKLAMNRCRKWKAPDAEGVVEHAEA